jgi:hypothetical protein
MAGGAACHWQRKLGCGQARGDARFCAKRITYMVRRNLSLQDLYNVEFLRFAHSFIRLIAWYVIPSVFFLVSF